MFLTRNGNPLHTADTVVSWEHEPLRRRVVVASQWRPHLRRVVLSAVDGEAKALDPAGGRLCGTVSLSSLSGNIYETCSEAVVPATTELYHKGFFYRDITAGGILERLLEKALAHIRALS